MSQINIRNKISKYAHLFFERGDTFLFGLCILCSLMSIYAVYIATSGMAAGGVSISVTKTVAIQVVSIIIGIAAFVVFTFFDADIMGDHWVLLCAINLLLLVALIIFGSADDTGNKAWIAIGPIHVQPSEIIKIIYIIVSAKQMTYLRDHADINSFWSVAQMAAHVGIVFVLILGISSDLGSATILLAIFLLMFYALGVKLYWFGIGGAAVAAMVPIIWTYVLKEYQKLRLIAPYDPSVDPDGWGITWQSTQSKLSLASGRLTGIEEGMRKTVFTGKHTDFIFAAIGEHFGMIGGLVVIVLLIIMIIHIVRIGLHTTRMYDMLICLGVAGAITFQTFINIGMCIGITPVIGLTLPFFSYGGSSMVTLFAAMGIISGIKYKPKPERFSIVY